MSENRQRSIQFSNQKWCKLFVSLGGGSIVWRETCTSQTRKRLWLYPRRLPGTAKLKPTYTSMGPSQAGLQRHFIRSFGGCSKAVARNTGRDSSDLSLFRANNGLNNGGHFNTARILFRGRPAIQQGRLTQSGCHSRNDDNDILPDAHGLISSHVLPDIPPTTKMRSSS